MIAKTEAIVLHSFKYGEQKLIVDMFTRQHGRVAFIVPLPKSSKGKLKKQYFQPLTLLQVTYDLRPQAQLQKLKDACLLMPLTALYGDPTKLAIALFIAEFLYHALRSEQQNEPLFEYLKSGILWFEGRQSSFANFHLVFLAHLSRFLGFYPNLEQGPNSDYFDLRAGTFCAVPPTHRDFLMPQEAAMMRLMMRMDLPTMHLFRMNRQQRGRCLEVALQYYQLHLPNFPELRSIQILKELFND